jgi:large subunit ribosomal protein L15
MSSLQTLKRNPGATKRPKVVGRGNGSGHGTYSTRGMNGQRQRTGSQKRPGFEGGQTPLHRRMPKLKGFSNPNRVSYQIVNVSELEGFDDNTEINVVRLYEKGIISSKNRPVKLLGDGDIKKKLTIKLDKCSASAKEKIEKAGGAITAFIKSES